MKRRLLGVLLAVAMVGTLAAGCGSKSTESEKKTEDKKVIKIARQNLYHLILTLFA